MIEARRPGAISRDTGVVADSLGYFEFPEISPGTYLITARTIGYYTQTDSIAVHDGYTVRLCMILTEAVVPIR
jgi:hypothetical protein